MEHTAGAQTALRENIESLERENQALKAALENSDKALNEARATLVRGATEAAQPGAVTVTTLPLRVTVPFQLSVILTLLGSVKVSLQLVDDRVPVLAIVKLRQKPLFQVESFFTVAVRVTVPGAGVGVGTGVGVGVGVGVGTGVGVGVVPAECVVTTMLFSCPAAEPDTHSPVSA